MSRRLSSSIRQLLERSPGASDPAEVIRAEARRLVQRALDHGWTGPPFDVEALADLRDIKVEYTSDGRLEDAILVPDPTSGQFTIKLSTEMPPERQRFNIGHEITHTFFPDCAETIQLRGGAPSKDKMVERLCDIGASEMLFPLEFFVRDVAALGGPSMSTLIELRSLYHGSWEATANRMTTTAEVAFAMLVFSERLKPTESTGQAYFPGLEPCPKLRLDYRVPSGHQDGFIPKHKSLPDDSKLYDLLDPASGEPIITSVEDWSDMRLGEVKVEGMRLPSDVYCPKVLAFVRPVSKR